MQRQWLGPGLRGNARRIDCLCATVMIGNGRAYLNRVGRHMSPTPAGRSATAKLTDEESVQSQFHVFPIGS